MRSLKGALCAVLSCVMVSQVSAQPPQPTPEECAKALADCMRMCKLTVIEIGGTTQLDTTELGTNLCDALRCLADCMGKTRCKTAVLQTDAGTVNWGRDHATTRDPNEVTIATSNNGTPASAGNSGNGSSAYASGGTTGGASASAQATGTNAIAGACGGHGAPAGNGGNAHANAPGPGGRAGAQGGQRSGWRKGWERHSDRQPICFGRRW